jgi:hypothetical protein
LRHIPSIPGETESIFAENMAKKRAFWYPYFKKIHSRQSTDSLFFFFFSGRVPLEKQTQKIGTTSEKIMKAAPHFLTCGFNVRN